MKTFVFDIETIPQDEKLILARAPEFRPAANLKDPVKIAASVEEKRAHYLARAALDWKTAQVVLIGVSDGENYRAFHGEEKTIIEEFLAFISAAMVDGHRVGGHNVKAFDLPMLINRARATGATIPQHILSYWNGRAVYVAGIFDTLEMLTFGDRTRIDGNGVDEIARALSMPTKLGHGSGFPALWRADKACGISYNQRDVEIEIEIARICGLL